MVHYEDIFLNGTNMTRLLRDLQKPHTHLIFDHLEVQPPAHSENRDAEPPVEKPSVERDNNNPLKQYKKTEDQLEKILRQLEHCRELLRKCEKGPELDVAMRMYSKIQMRVARMIPDFPKLRIYTKDETIPWGENSNIQEGINAIRLLARDKKAEVLRRVGIDLSENDLSGRVIDPSATHIVEYVKKLRPFGMSDQNILDFMEILRLSKKESKIAELIPYMKKAKELNLDAEEASSCWLDDIPFSDVEIIAKGLGIRSKQDLKNIRSLLRPLHIDDHKAMTSKEIIDEVEKMKKAGIRDGYIDLLCKTRSNENINYTLLNELIKVGITENAAYVYRIMKKYHSDDIPDFIRLIVMLKTTEESMIRSINYEMVDHKYRASDIIGRIDEMKKAGINEGYNDLILVTANEIHPNYDRIKKLMSLKDIIHMKYIVKLSNFDIDDEVTIRIIKELQQEGIKANNIFDYYIALYKICNTKNSETIDDLHRLVKLMDIKDAFDIYNLSLIKKKYNMTNKDITERVNYFMKQGVADGYLDVVCLLGVEYGGVDQTDYKAMKEYAKDLKSLSIRPDIWKLYWKEIKNKNDVKTAIAFQREHPEMMNKIRMVNAKGATDKEKVSMEERDTIGKIRFAAWYIGQTPEMQKFVEEMIRRHNSTTYMNVRHFAEDELLQVSLEVYKNMEKKDVEEAIRFGRSLFLHGMNTLPDEQTLQKELKKFNEVQAKADKIQIVAGRNVVKLNNGEIWDEGGEGYKKGELRFNDEERRKELIKSIGPMPPGSLLNLAPESDKPTVKNLAEVKKRALEAIMTTPPPMTFMFDGHGGTDKLYMNNGKVSGDKPIGVDTDFITTNEIASAISKRKEKFSREALLQDIYIYASCMNHNFMRNVYKEIKCLGGVPPISIGESEYGQYGFSDMDKFKNMYQFGTLGTTIGHLRENELKYLSSNFTIFVPDENGDIFQVAMDEPGAKPSGENNDTETKPT